MIYPFLLRDLTKDPCYCSRIPPAFDITTPYGYGGPFYWGTTDARKIGEPFWDAFRRWVERKGVVSEFIRFSLFQEDLLYYPGEREERQTNIVRTLDLDDDLLWMDFEHKVRKNVKKAQRNGLTVVADPDGDRLHEFLNIYSSTMDRRNAGPAYFFPREFFLDIKGGLSGQSLYFHAVFRGRIVSSELVLVSAETVYSFLGGTVSSSFELRPNDLLKYEIIRWCRAHKMRHYVLGGGFQPDDGIFRYKRTFAPNGCYPFFVGHRIFDSELYQTLINIRREFSEKQGEKWIPRADFFPEYRA